MNEPKEEPGAFHDPDRIEGYHAHVYYDPGTKPAAQRLREAIGARFKVRLGSWHDNPVGPHPAAMYQVLFAVEELPRLLPFLMLNREGLSVLVHPVTGTITSTMPISRSGWASPCPCCWRRCGRIWQPAPYLVSPPLDGGGSGWG